MNVAPPVVSVAVAVFLVTAVPLPAKSLAQAAASTVDATNAARARPFTGAWTLNREQSDQPQPEPPARDGDERGGGRRGGGRGGRGGFGGGFGGRGGAGGGTRDIDPQAAARAREAMRDVTSPPDHLVIVSTDTMILLTGPDGRTTRLSPDNKKIKDENTNVERRTRWDGVKLVSEISGLGPGKITETYAVDEERHQLRVAADLEGVRGGPPRTISHVYDQDAR